MSVKENDVYEFMYNDGKERFYPYHCFDGTLIATKRKDGSLYFRDTYWGSGGSRTFSIEEAFNKGKMTFLMNFADVEEIDKSNAKYYDDEDIIHLRIHAGYRDRFFIKKGTERSKDKMLNYCKRKISDAESDIQYAKRQIEQYKEKIEEIKSGNIDTYI